MTSKNSAHKLILCCHNCDGLKVFMLLQCNRQRCLRVVTLHYLGNISSPGRAQRIMSQAQHSTR